MLRLWPNVTNRIPQLARWRQRIAQLPRLEFDVVVAFLALAFGGWTFAELSSEVAEGNTTYVDERILMAFRNPNDLADPIGPGWVEEAVRDFTALGGTALLTLLSTAIVTHLCLRRMPKAAGFVALCVGGGFLLSLALKQWVARPRPNLVPQLSHVMTSSFPSGHSMLSAAVYLTLGALLARFEAGVWLKVHILSWAVAVTVLVGVSRVYLGVHWPTDVLAGWAVGAAWAAACWLLALRLQRTGRVEGEQSTEASSP